MSDVVRCIVLTVMTALVVIAMGTGAAMVAAIDPTNAHAGSESSSNGLSPVPLPVDPGTDARSAYKASQLNREE